MNKQLTLGSLFDGSGGFPLGAIFNGIKPVWASEIEPFPIRVTTKRFPEMEHLGDISKINGGEIQPVDIIAFGSPCTDLSVAGKRAGLGGEQSSLFYEAIRIVKEMRCKTGGRYPRFIVWENVPGAFSSNKGEDFRAVLNSIVEVAEETAEVPAPEKNGWSYADILVGNGWSIAYRTIDAQYFGVAQRRKRIFLVADFGSERAGEILFESEGLSRNFTQGQISRAEVTGSAGSCFASAGNEGVVAFEPGALSRLGSHASIGITGTLRANMGDNQIAVAVENHPSDGRCKFREDGKVQTLTSRMGTGGNNVPLAMQSSQNEKHSICIQGNMIGRKDENGPNGSGLKEDTCFTLTARDRHAVAYGFTTGGFVDAHKEKAATLKARDSKDPQLVHLSMQNEKGQLLERKPGDYIIRRLTPKECQRLQGFPEGWCDDLETSDPVDAEVDRWVKVFESYWLIAGTTKKPKSRKQVIKWLKAPFTDAAAYKMWGNGVALPCVDFVLGGITELIQREHN